MLEAFTFADYHLRIDCRENETCTVTSGWSLNDLYVLYYRQLVGLGLEVSIRHPRYLKLEDHAVFHRFGCYSVQAS